MIWKRLLFLLLLSVLVFPLFSQENPEEMSTQEILNELIAITEQERLDLIEEKSQFEKDKRERILEIQNDRAILIKDRAELTEDQNSWQNYKLEMQAKIKASYWKGFLHGGLVGFGVGGAGAFWISIKIRL